MPLPTAAEDGARTFLRDRAYDSLFDAIQSGQLVPGEILRDDELMDWLGMSRTPIRHALIRLAEAGLIEMSAGRQTKVAELRADRTNRALFVSALYNEYAVRHVAGRLDDGQLQRLQAAREHLRTAVVAGEGLGIARAISGFFDSITDAVGNSVLDEQIDRIDAELARFLQPGSASIDVESTVAGIESLGDALDAGDRDVAIERVIAIYRLARQNFTERYREPETD